MLFNLLVTLASLSLLFPRILGFDYCNIKCNGTEHTLCAYSEGGGESCLNNEQVYLSVEEKRYILELHNNFRHTVAHGGLNSSGQPSASNMFKMVWDPEVALIAKRWADQCDAEEHDKCRTTMDGESLGQNTVLGEYKFSDPETDWERAHRLNKLINTWKNEVFKFYPHLITRYDIDSAGNTTHYTQMVWATSIFIGCGYTEFRMPNDVVKFRFVCNYKPKGNIPFAEVYRPGKPCSHCLHPNNCSETWNTLCWDGTSSEFVIPTSFAYKLLTPRYLACLLFFILRYM